MLIACVDATVKHYGSCSDSDCCGSFNDCPVSSYISAQSPTFVRINGKTVSTRNDRLIVPTHRYRIVCTTDDEGNCVFDHYKYHSHNVTVNSYTSHYVRINGIQVMLPGDKNTSTDTRVEDSGSNTFVSINF